MEKYFFNLYLTVNGLVAGNPHKTFYDDHVSEHDQEFIGVIEVTWAQLEKVLGRKHIKHGQSVE